MSERLEDLQEQCAVVMRKIDAIERKAAREEAQALVGKCFKYRNNYSCPQKESDYWWLYVRILAATQDAHLTGTSFQIDSYGDANIKAEKHLYPKSFLGDRGYVEITLAEFTRAAANFETRLLALTAKATAAVGR